MSRNEHFATAARAAYFDSEPSHLNWVHFAKHADSADWGGSFPGFPERAHEAKEEGDLAPNRSDDYDDYGGAHGYARRVGGYREDRKYDDHNGPITVSHEEDGRVSVYDGHHRALDAMARRVRRIPVEWS